MTTAESPRVRTEVQVMFFDTDCGGVVHNIAYLRFIEIARTLLAEQLGLMLTEMAATQRYPVVVRTEIDYRRAAKLGDHLTVEGCLDFGFCKRTFSSPNAGRCWH
jgi:YbgC/YbaW family acyl-CoA thioester hydrolase